MGLFFDAEDEERWTKGYPHVVVLVDGHAHDKKPHAAVPRIYTKYFGAYHVRWPRKVAARFVRAMAATEGRAKLDAPAAALAAANDAPITEADASALLASQLVRPRRASTYQDEHFLFCLEALAGTDAVLRALATHLESLGDDRIGMLTPELAADARIDAKWSIDDAVPAFFAYLAGYLLLRASPAVASEARERLENVWQSLASRGTSLEEHSPRGGLDLALHGMDAARRVFPTSHWQYLTWWGFVDDAAMLRERFVAKWKSEWVPDPRHVWLTRGEVLPDLAKKAPMRSLGPRRPWFLEDVGAFALPAVTDLMIDWAADKNAGPVARAWLKNHHAFAKARLAERAPTLALD